MSDGIDKLTTTVAESIDAISKSFSEHAPEVWQSAVAYQKSTAFIEIIYGVVYAIIILTVYFFIVRKFFDGPIKELKDSGAGMCKTNYYEKDGINHERYQTYRIFRTVCTIAVSIFILIQIGCSSRSVKRYMNAEYYAAIELMKIVRR